MKGYKGFNKGLVCRGKQYAENTVFEEETAKICESGMHFCENPFDVLGYYGFIDDDGNLNEFAEVEPLAEVHKSEDKCCTTKLKIGAKIGIMGLVKAFVNFTMERISDKKSGSEISSAATNTGYQSAATNTGYQSAATNTGRHSAATNTGYQSAATNTGRQSAATNTGYQSAATNTGDYSAATNTGRQSAATNTGDYSAATNTGYQSAATNTGDYSAATNTGRQSAATNTGYQSAATNTGRQSAATNTGDYSAATVSGKESIAIATGFKSRAKGTLGCWIVLAEWDDNAEHIICVKSHKVDGNTIKADTFYTLKNGKFVKSEQGE